jgi:hypothetical protein
MKNRGVRLTYRSGLAMVLVAEVGPGMPDAGKSIAPRRSLDGANRRKCALDHSQEAKACYFHRELSLTLRGN